MPYLRPRHWVDKDKRLIIGSGYSHLGYGTSHLHESELQGRVDETATTLPSWVPTDLPDPPFIGTTRPPLKRSTFKTGSSMEALINLIRAAEKQTATLTVPDVNLKLDGERSARDHITATLERWDYEYNARYSIQQDPTKKAGLWAGVARGSADGGSGEDWQDAIDDLSQTEWFPEDDIIGGNSHVATFEGRDTGEDPDYDCIRRRTMNQITIQDLKFPETPSGWSVSFEIEELYDDWSYGGWGIQLWGGPFVTWTDHGSGGYTRNSTLITTLSKATLQAAVSAGSRVFVDVSSFVGTLSAETDLTFWLMHDENYPSAPTTSGSAYWREGIKIVIADTLSGDKTGIRLHSYVDDPDNIVNDI